MDNNVNRSIRKFEKLTVGPAAPEGSNKNPCVRLFLVTQKDRTLLSLDPENQAIAKERGYWIVDETEKAVLESTGLSPDELSATARSWGVIIRNFEKKS